MAPRHKQHAINEAEFYHLLDAWPALSPKEHLRRFTSLPHHQAEELFLQLPSSDQVEIYRAIPDPDKRAWIRLLPPDNAADLVQRLTAMEQETALLRIEEPTRSEVKALMAYEEDVGGGLMNSQFVRLRPNMTVEEAIHYIRAQTRTLVETIYYSYVLDHHQKLLGVVSLRQLLTRPPFDLISEVMVKGADVITVHEDMHQEEISQIFSKSKPVAIPVVDENGIMKGILTVKDIVQVVEREATEDMQKIGGMEALDAPYFKIGFFKMVQRRAGWLMALFIGEMFTATAMGYYEDQIAKAVVLALFIPLIISSGGNSGSQASTLMVRSIALGEVKLRDWWRVLYRELGSGLALGLVLGAVGTCRILFWPGSAALYGPHYVMIAMTVGSSLIGIVLWGTISGSMLPFVLKKLSFDPATASAPFVATLVDVTGLIIYFTVASIFLKGILL